MKVTDIKEDERQLIVRGLAVQSLRYPGFEMACRQAAVTFAAVKMFDDFRRTLADENPPRGR